MVNFYAENAGKFKFGWEVEIMLTDRDFSPLFGAVLPFEKIRNILQSIEAESIPYLKEKYTGSGLLPYYVEGYDAGYDDQSINSVVVKGIEIRTPIAFGIEDSVSLFEGYYNKLQRVVEDHGMHLCCFGNHPFQPSFKGEKGRRNVIEWASAETAMTTHGLVINISLPDDLEEKLDRHALNIRFAYAAPVMILFAGNTPFRQGGLWTPGGKQAFSDRSYRRSFVRDTVYYRDDQNNRKEITLFDMTNDLSMYAAYAALSLGIILSDEDVPVIPDRFSKENVRRTSLYGYDAEWINRHHDTFRPEEAAAKILSMCSVALERYGFDKKMLKPLYRLLEKRELPAHETVSLYQKEQSIQSVLKIRRDLMRSA